jgi:hypothetical protein
MVGVLVLTLAEVWIGCRLASRTNQTTGQSGYQAPALSDWFP